MIRRAACCLCLSLLLGILYGRGREWWFLLGFLLLALYMAAAMMRISRDARNAACVRVALCLCLFSAGFVKVQAQQAVRDRVGASVLEGDSIAVQGKVLKKEQRDAFLGRPEDAGAARQAGLSQDQQFIYYLTDTRVISGSKSFPCFGILVYSQNGSFQPGNHLMANGKYAPFQISRNEGNFSERDYQQCRKWEFKLYADSEELISGREDKYAVFLAGLREKMQAVFVDAMEAQDAGVLADIALGEKSLLDAEIKGLYRSAGISHVLAISGLHVSLLGMGVFSLLRKSRCPGKARALICAAVVFSFGVFSGMGTSTVRAVVMFMLLMFAHVCGRSYDSLTALSLCAAFQAWGNPFLLWYAGFLFSYGAVLGVVVVWEVIKKARQKEKGGSGKVQDAGAQRGPSYSGAGGRLFAKGKKAALGMWETLCASACIQLATLPLLAYFYYEIPTYSLLTNACILPFMGTLLALGLAGGILGIVLPVLGNVVLQPAAWLLAYNESVCRISGELPFASLITGRPPLWMVAAYYAVLIVSLYFVWLRGRRGYLAAVVVALACLLFVRAKQPFELDVLDVGQGDGIFIQNDNGEHFFLDGGSSDVKGVGERRILPFLKSHGIRSVKGWIVSHGDADHVSGLIELLQLGYPVESLVLSERMVRDEAMKSLLEEARRSGCKVCYVSPGMKFGSGELIFTVLAPGGASEPGSGRGGKALVEGSAGSNGDRNALSLSLLLEYRGFRGVFTGDIGTEQEQALLESGCLGRYGVGQVDFYKAAHHGSNGSNCQAFLDKVSPKMAVVSCAKKNSYGHPGKDAVARMKEAGSRVFFTMEQGQVCVQPKGKGVRVWTFLP